MKTLRLLTVLVAAAVALAAPGQGSSIPYSGIYKADSGFQTVFGTASGRVLPNRRIVLTLKGDLGGHLTGPLTGTGVFNGRPVFVQSFTLPGNGLRVTFRPTQLANKAPTGPDWSVTLVQQ